MSCVSCSILDYIRKEQVEIAPSEKGIGDEFYLPHHAVKKVKRGETKWRILLTDPLMKTTLRL
jgi:hypothetical protein